MKFSKNTPHSKGSRDKWQASLQLRTLTGALKYAYRHHHPCPPSVQEPAEYANYQPSSPGPDPLGPEPGRTFHKQTHRCPTVTRRYLWLFVRSHHRSIFHLPVQPLKLATATAKVSQTTPAMNSLRMRLRCCTGLEYVYVCPFALVCLQIWFKSPTSQPASAPKTSTRLDRPFDFNRTAVKTTILQGKPRRLGHPAPRTRLTSAGGATSHRLLPVCALPHAAHGMKLKAKATAGCGRTACASSSCPAFDSVRLRTHRPVGGLCCLECRSAVTSSNALLGYRFVSHRRSGFTDANLCKSSRPLFFLAAHFTCSKVQSSFGSIFNLPEQCLDYLSVHLLPLFGTAVAPSFPTCQRASSYNRSHAILDRAHRRRVDGEWRVGNFSYFQSFRVFAVMLARHYLLLLPGAF